MIDAPSIVEGEFGFDILAWFLRIYRSGKGDYSAVGRRKLDKSAHV